MDDASSTGPPATWSLDAAWPAHGRRLLQIYLRDHLAAAVAGTELAKRAAGNNRATAMGPRLQELASEIEEDRRSLVALMEALGIRPDPLKVTAAWGLEKLARLKLNGRVLRYSPLSRLLELEGLLSGIEGKRALWTALKAAMGDEQPQDVAQLRMLEDRAADQRRRVEELRLRAAREAFPD